MNEGRSQPDMEQRRKVAVIGAGISGLAATLVLIQAQNIDVTLFEAGAEAGGHAHTVRVNVEGRTVDVDTGFIVYNESNYPHLTAMLTWLNVATSPSEMSFALTSGDGAFEWCGQDVRPLSGLFAQKSNLLRPGFWLFLKGILDLQRVARADVAQGRIGDETLGAYLAARGLSRRVINDYIVPMGAAIWSMTPRDTLDFPARSFFAFFENHKLLQRDRPKWRTVTGGSRRYVEACEKKIGNRLKLDCGIRSVRRNGQGVVLTDIHGISHEFDDVILACHAPTTLALLEDASNEERRVLSAFRVSQNKVVLHRDIAQMPKRRAAWAAWNVKRADDQAPVAVTYWMNRLQPLDGQTPLFITLNPVLPISPQTILGEFDYAHPVYDAAAIAAQAQLPGLQGGDHVYFAGAWTEYGFHEDGLRSGLNAAKALGGVLPW